EADAQRDRRAHVQLPCAAGERIGSAPEQDGRNHLSSFSTQGGEATLLTPGNHDVEDVRLSGDKKYVIYSSNQFSSDPQDEDRRHLWRVNASAGAPQQLSRGQTMEWSPV